MPAGLICCPPIIHAGKRRLREVGSSWVEAKQRALPLLNQRRGSIAQSLELLNIAHRWAIRFDACEKEHPYSKQTQLKSRNQLESDL